MHKNVQTNPKKIDTTLLLFYVDTRIFLKAIRGNIYRFVPKGGMFPSETMTLVVRSSGLWDAYTQTGPKWDKIFTTACWCRCMIACQVSWISRVLDLLEFKNQASQRFASNQQCPGVWNSFPSLAWDLEIHPRTHMWFFNQLGCIGACACRSNLNYAHKMARKPS